MMSQPSAAATSAAAAATADALRTARLARVDAERTLEALEKCESLVEGAFSGERAAWASERTALEARVTHLAAIAHERERASSDWASERAALEATVTELTAKNASLGAKCGAFHARQANLMEQLSKAEAAGATAAAEARRVQADAEQVRGESTEGREALLKARPGVLTGATQRNSSSYPNPCTPRRWSSRAPNGNGVRVYGPSGRSWRCGRPAACLTARSTSTRKTRWSGSRAAAAAAGGVRAGAYARPLFGST